MGDFSEFIKLVKVLGRKSHFKGGESMSSFSYEGFAYLTFNAVRTQVDAQALSDVESAARDRLNSGALRTSLASTSNRRSSVNSGEETSISRQMLERTVERVVEQKTDRLKQQLDAIEKLIKEMQNSRA